MDDGKMVRLAVKRTMAGKKFLIFSFFPQFTVFSGFFFHFFGYEKRQNGTFSSKMVRLAGT